MNRSTKAWAIVRSNWSFSLKAIILTSSPVSGYSFLMLGLLRKRSVWRTIFSVSVIGAYPTAAEVSFAPRSRPFHNLQLLLVDRNLSQLTNDNTHLYYLPNLQMLMRVEADRFAFSAGRHY